MMTIQEELEAIREEHNGILRAEDVLEYAKNPDTALHKKFIWDDTEAARQYRLAQARAVIRVNVIVPDATLTPVRAYVSLYSDRQQPGGGYRHLSDVLTHNDRRKQLLAQALKEARTWREKYKNLAELAPVFGAIDEAQEIVLPAAPSDARETLVA